MLEVAMEVPEISLRIVTVILRFAINFTEISIVKQTYYLKYRNSVTNSAENVIEILKKNSCYYQLLLNYLVVEISMESVD